MIALGAPLSRCLYNVLRNDSLHQHNADSRPATEGSYYTGYNTPTVPTGLLTEVFHQNISLLISHYFLPISRVTKPKYRRNARPLLLVLAGGN